MRGRGSHLWLLAAAPLLPGCADALDVLPLPPGLRRLLHDTLGWVLSLDGGGAPPPPGGGARGASSSESDSEEGGASDRGAGRRKRCRWT
ncbi:unnamed protein product [Boreogadus saida]